MTTPISTKPVTLPEFIRLLRGRSGLTQAQAAAEIGVSVATLSRYESGIRGIPLHHLQGMARLYGVELETVATP